MATTKKEKKAPPAVEDIPLPFLSPTFAIAWAEWLEYRKQRRLPKYVPIGLKKTFTILLKDCNNDEATAITMIDHAIAKNWQGIFQIKTNTNGTHQKNSVRQVPGADNNEGSFGQFE